MTGPAEGILTGRAADLANAGFTEMPDPLARKKESGFESPLDAAAELSAQRGKPAPTIARKYNDGGNGEADAAEAITLERGARDLTTLRSDENDAAQDENAARFRDELDRLRGDRIAEPDANDPARPDVQQARDAKEKPGERRWACAKLLKQGTFQSVARHLMTQPALSDCLGKTGVPSFVIAVIHERESSQDWSRSLAQGGPLDRISVHVPAGRGPSESWEDAVVDALVNCAPYRATSAMPLLLNPGNSMNLQLK